MNENYKHPAIPKDCEKGILKGMYLFKEFNNKGKIKIQLLGCGTILREMLAAAEILSKDYGVDSDVWSVTSFNELRRNGMEVERKNLRKFFEVDKEHIVTYSLSVLAKEQLISSKHAKEAMKKYKIDPEKPIPTKL